MRKLRHIIPAHTAYCKINYNPVFTFAIKHTLIQYATLNYRPEKITSEMKFSITCLGGGTTLGPCAAFNFYSLPKSRRNKNFARSNRVLRLNVFKMKLVFRFC